MNSKEAHNAIEKLLRDDPRAKAILDKIRLQTRTDRVAAIGMPPENVLQMLRERLAELPPGGQ